MSNHHHKHHGEHKDDSVLNCEAAEVLEPEVVSDEEVASLDSEQNEVVEDVESAEGEAHDAAGDASDSEAEARSDSAQADEAAGKEESADRKAETDWRDAYV